jgi:tyrosyl-tRNA synthetase
VTIAQLLTRDDFSNRMKSESAIYLHECLYPLMQAWDSVEIKADIELGGTEQLFSFMLARELQRDEKLPLQIGIMSPILVGLDGVRRMGKSLGNYIGIAESSYDMMKKFMQIPDDVMKMFFELLTDLPMSEVDEILASHPKEAKIALGKTVIEQYHTGQEADDAAARWEKEIGQGALPADIPVRLLPPSELEDGKIMAVKLLSLLGMCNSSGEARRLIAQGAAYLGEEKDRIESHDQLIAVEDGLLVRVGKKKICRVDVTGN